MQLVIRATCSRLLFLVGWNIWIIEICYAQLIPEVPSECTHDVPASLALSTLSMLNETLGESDKEFQTCFEQVLQSRSLLHPDQELRTVSNPHFCNYLEAEILLKISPLLLIH